MQFIEIRFVMTKSYQLVAWTDKGQVRMIPSEVTDYIHAELEAIDRQADSIRYRSEQERGGILKLSQAYEKLAVGLQRLGRIEDAFEQYARAAQCCLQSKSHLQQSCDHVTYPFDCFEENWNSCAGDPDEAMAYNKALRFGKNEVYRRRRA